MPVVIGAKRDSDFTDPMGMLGDCHRRIERFLQALVRIADEAKGERLSEQQNATLEAGLRYFRESAPRHTADEEESLFPRMRQNPSPAVETLLTKIDALEQDHERADCRHQEVDRLGRAWLERGTLSKPEADRLRVLLAELSEIYKEHIAFEDNEVFPVAQRALSAAERAGVGAEMAARRGVSRASACDTAEEYNPSQRGKA